jgi:hypothetical protein
MEMLSNLRCSLERARSDASLAEYALRRAERRSQDTTRELERYESAYREVLHLFVGQRQPAVMEAWSYAQSALANATTRGETLKQVLEEQLAVTPRSQELLQRLDDELHCFFGFTWEAIRALAKLRLATASSLRALHDELKRGLDELRLAGFSALISQDRAVAEAAKGWIEHSMQLLKMAPSLVDSELEWVVEELERVEAEQARLEAQRQQTLR